MSNPLKTTIIALAMAGGGAIGLGTVASASYGDEPPVVDDTVQDTGEDTGEDTGADTGTVEGILDGDDAIDESGGDVAPDSLQDATDGEAEDRGCRGRNSEAVAAALGLTTDEVRAARGAGQSLAEIAADQGVAVDVVVAAIVDDIEEHLAEEVAEGDLTQEEADERLAGAEERATEKVDAEPGDGGPRGARGPGGPPTPADA